VCGPIIGATDEAKFDNVTNDAAAIQAATNAANQDLGLSVIEIG
jgi:hypothetical protein